MFWLLFESHHSVIMMKKYKKATKYQPIQFYIIIIIINKFYYYYYYCCDLGNSCEMYEGARRDHENKNNNWHRLAFNEAH